MHEQRGHPGRAGQQPEADNQDGLWQWAEAGWAHKGCKHFYYQFQNWVVSFLSPKGFFS